MNLKALENDLRRDSEQLSRDARQFVTDAAQTSRDFASDVAAEAKHVADPSQRASIVERHVGFIALLLCVFLVFYFGVIAVILSWPKWH